VFIFVPSKPDADGLLAPDTGVTTFNITGALVGCFLSIMLARRFLSKSAPATCDAVPSVDAGAALAAPPILPTPSPVPAPPTAPIPIPIPVILYSFHLKMLQSLAQHKHKITGRLPVNRHTRTKYESSVQPAGDEPLPVNETAYESIYETATFGNKRWYSSLMVA
jgi:hypothetical protein